MNRIKKRFEKLKQENRAGLVTFLMAGDPNLETSQSLLNALPEAGADIIELGMPFSDPMADGPAIQNAGIRALKAGTTLRNVLGMVEQFRENDDETPIILMGYYNPIFVYGKEAFIRDAAEAGVDGLILVDLPPEEDEISDIAKEAGIDFIRLVAPTTDDTRLPKVVGNASGFIYYVSVAGITGTKSADKEALLAGVGRIRRHTSLPVAIGFGIKTPEQAAEAGNAGDAVVVGSALVKLIEDHPRDCKNKISEAVRALAGALR